MTSPIGISSITLLKLRHADSVCRDCAAGNIMVDGSPLYPQGFHPVHIHRSYDFTSTLHPLQRSEHPVKYYFIDFGISSRFQDGQSPLVLGTQGRDKAPELSKTIPYNAFQVDIWMLGRVFEQEFMEVRRDSEFRSRYLSSLSFRDT